MLDLRTSCRPIVSVPSVESPNIFLKVNSLFLKTKHYKRAILISCPKPSKDGPTKKHKKKLRPTYSTRHASSKNVPYGSN